MFCPECRAEFVPDTLQCSDCGVALVERIDAPGADARAFRAEKGELITLLASTSEATISLAKHLLEAEGIPYQVRGENLRGLYSWGSEGGIFHGVDPKLVIICSADRDRAMKLMNDHDLASD